jgi:cobalt/nickel transport protein
VRKNWVINLLLVAGIVGIVVFALILDSGRSGEQERFVGSDSAATAQIEQDNPDYQPWFEPLYAPTSGEIESGLFALQAALGGIVLGYCFGALRTRRKVEEAVAAANAARS